MLMNYIECVKKYGNAYQIKKAIDNDDIFKIENGIYSDDKYWSELSVLLKKYPNVILTGGYAYYYYGLTDLIPDKYTFATDSKASSILDERVQQIYIRKDLLSLGIIEAKIDDSIVKIYDKERMLIELLRNKNTMPYDLYKEILHNYRMIINSLEIWRIQEYASIFPKSKMITKALDDEIM